MPADVELVVTVAVIGIAGGLAFVVTTVIGVLWRGVSWIASLVRSHHPLPARGRRDVAL